VYANKKRVVHYAQSGQQVCVCLQRFFQCGSIGLSQQKLFARVFKVKVLLHSTSFTFIRAGDATESRSLQIVYRMYGLVCVEYRRHYHKADFPIQKVHLHSVHAVEPDEERVGVVVQMVYIIRHNFAQ